MISRSNNLCSLLRFFFNQLRQQTTYTYCTQLLDTYAKLCSAENRKLPRNVTFSQNRLVRAWPQLIDRLKEFSRRAQTAETFYSSVDTVNIADLCFVHMFVAYEYVSFWEKIIIR